MTGRSRVAHLALLFLAINAEEACTGRSPSAPASTPVPIADGVAAAIFLTPNNWDLPAGGGVLELTIATAGSESGNVAAPNVPLTLSASSGQLSDTAPRTDRTGHVKVTWTGTSSATITARAGDVVGTSTIRVAGTAPPIPTPNPNPNPNPGPGPTPSPDPRPGPARLIVEVFPSPNPTDASSPVLFNNRVLSIDGTPVGALTYAWDFNQDGVVDSTEATPTHLFPPADHWNVTVRVTSADGRTGSATSVIVVGASPAPTVEVTLAAAPRSALIGETFTFTATATGNSTSGPVVVYDWDFDPAVASDNKTTTTNSTSFTYGTAGPRTVRVTAWTANRENNGTATTAITVSDFPLVVTLSVSPPPTTNTLVTVTATVTSTGSVPTDMTFEWDYTDDGTFDQTTVGGPSSTGTTLYNTTGKKTIRVTVTAKDGRTVTNTLEITVN